MKLLTATLMISALAFQTHAAQCPSPKVLAKALKGGFAAFDVRGNRIDDDPIGGGPDHDGAELEREPVQSSAADADQARAREQAAAQRVRGGAGGCGCRVGGGAPLAS